MTSPSSVHPSLIAAGLDQSCSIVEQHRDVTVAREHVRRNRIGRAICKLSADVLEWHGTAAQLLEELKRLHPNDRRLADQTPGGLGQHLGKLREALANAGCVTVETERVGHKRTRTIYLMTIDPTACADVAMKAPTKPIHIADSADSVHASAPDVKQALTLAISSVIPARRK